MAAPQPNVFDVRQLRQILPKPASFIQTWPLASFESLVIGLAKTLDIYAIHASGGDPKLKIAKISGPLNIRAVIKLNPFHGLFFKG